MAGTDRLRAVPKVNMHLLRQIVIVTRIGLSTLRHRRRGAVVMMVGVGAMAFTLLSFLAIAEGLHIAFLKSGNPARAVIRGANLGQAFQLGRSKLPANIAMIAAAAPGVARGSNGLPLVEAESLHGIRPVKRNNGETGETVIIGVGPQWLEMTPSFRLLSGRLPHAGTREVMAGTLAQRKFSSLDAGFASYKARRWPIVGIFRADGWWNGYLVGDAAMLKAAAANSIDNIVRARLTSPQAFEAFRQRVAGQLPPGFMVERESDLYADYWRDVPKVVLYLAYLLGGLIGTGAFAATVQTMQGAVEERGREIAILRTLGFDGVAVAASVVIEAMLLAALGAFFGTALVWLWLDGFLYNAGSVFRLTSILRFCCRQSAGVWSSRCRACWDRRCAWRGKRPSKRCRRFRCDRRGRRQDRPASRTPAATTAPQ